MRIVIAIDKFAGTLTAPEAARAVAEGWHRTAPDDEVLCVPMADGGPGFLDAMETSLSSRGTTVERRSLEVQGPRGNAVDADVLLTGEGAYVEAAEAAGLHLVPPGVREQYAKTASTYGVGQILGELIEQRHRRIVIGLGGTATTDGGAGMLAALGAEPADILRRGGGALKELESLDLTAARERVAGIEIVIASDVDNPLLGLRGASAVFGPQKGATPDDVQRLDAALTHFAQLAGAIGQEPGALRRTLDAPGAGAGGGLGYGLLLLGGHRVPGIGTVIAETGLADLIATADLVITGEGRFDHSSLGGKVPTGVAETALKSGRPCIVLAGLVEVGKRELANAGFAAAYEVAEQAGSAEEAMARPAFHLAALAERVAKSWSRS